MAGIGAVLTLCGAALDRVMLRRQKLALYSAMIEWWVRIHETPIRDLGRDTAAFTRGFIDRVPRDRRWRRVVGITVLISLALTTAAAYIGQLADRNGIFDFAVASWLFYLINLTFDLATVWVTYSLLGVVARGGLVKSMFAVIADASIALILAIVCLWSLTVAADIFSRKWWAFIPDENEEYYAQVLADSIGVLPDEIISDLELGGIDVNYRRRVVYSARWIGGLLHGDLSQLPADTVIQYVRVQNNAHSAQQYSVRVPTKPTSWWGVTVAASTLLPTAVFLTFLSITILAKGVVEFFRFVVLHILEVLTEMNPAVYPEKFAPGTLFGLFFGVLGAACKLLTDLVKVIADSGAG
jgi:hypothetical protein